MSDGVFADYDGVALAAPGSVRRLATRATPGIVILASSALLGVWMVYIRPAQAPVAPITPVAVGPSALQPFGELSVLSVETSLQPARPDQPASSDMSESDFDKAAPFTVTFPVDPYGALAELNASVSHDTLGLRPILDLDLESGLNPADALVAVAPQAVAPLPPRRPADLGVSTVPAATPTPAVASHDTNPPAPSAPGFFEKLFAGIHAPQGQGQTVAYANPETTSVGRSAQQNPVLRSVAPWSSAPSGMSRYDKFTAVYDIEARTVYLPDGRRLEAHSGLGDLKDDPKHVDTRAKGATPPDVYELTAREGLFHGIQALRLKPVGSGEQFGRTGLLAHPYMLGPDGDSFGCVSFKDYDAFLTAYQSGQVKKLAVVAKLD